MRTERQPTGFQLAIELSNPLFDPCTSKCQWEIAKPKVQQFLVREAIQSGIHGMILRHMTQPAQIQPCSNCGTHIIGPFCSQCGQENRKVPETVSAFLEEIDLTRASRTIRALMLKPGELTRAYLTGDRVKYAQPLRVYVIAITAFFLVHAYSPFVRLDPETRAVSNSLSTVSVGFELTEAWFSGLRERGISVDAFGARYAAVISATLPALFLMTLILFSGGLAAFYRRSQVKFIGHMVFALHWSAFYFTLTVLDRVLPAVGVRGLALPLLFTILAVVYLVLAGRRVYGQSWARSVLSSMLLWMGFIVLLAAWLYLTTQIARASF